MSDAGGPFEPAGRTGDPRLVAVAGPLLASDLAGDGLTARADGDPDD